MNERVLMNEDVEPSTRLEIMRREAMNNLQNGGDSTRVLYLFQKVLELPEPDAEMALMCATFMKLKEMPEDSINAVLTKALEVAPDNVGVRLQLVQSKWMGQDYNAVIDLCEPATEYNPDEMAFYYFLGLAHFQKDERDKALDAFRRGVSQINEESNPDFVSDFYAIMGQILHDKGLDDEAFAAYDSSLQWKDDNIEVLNNYAYYLSERGERLQKAEQMSYRTIKAEPTNSTFLDTYAWILFMQERYEEAKIYIDQALQNDSTVSGVIIEHAGDIYAMNKDMQQAVDYWKQAQKAGNDSKVLIRKIRQRKYLKK